MNASLDENLTLWYLIYTRSRHEKKVNYLLEQKNFNTFFPQITEIKQWSDRKRKMIVPLFPNYIFIKTIPRNFWKIRNLPGVVRFVGQKAEKGPVPVPDKVINSIEKILKGEVTVLDVSFNKGDRVKVISGPFMGIEGIYKEKCNKNMLIFEVELIQRSICIEINPIHLERIKDDR